MVAQIFEQQRVDNNSAGHRRSKGVNNRELNYGNIVVDMKTETYTNRRDEKLDRISLDEKFEKRDMKLGKPGHLSFSRKPSVSRKGKRVSLTNLPGYDSRLVYVKASYIFTWETRIHDDTAS